MRKRMKEVKMSLSLLDDQDDQGAPGVILSHIRLIKADDDF